MDRKAAKQQYGALFTEVASLLLEADPIGINFGDNPDEYEPEAGTILPRLSIATTAKDTQEIIYDEFCRWFGQDTVGPKDKYQAVSERIWTAWLAFKAKQS